jgi:hypothetical protein
MKAIIGILFLITVSLLIQLAGSTELFSNFKSLILIMPVFVVAAVPIVILNFISHLEEYENPTEQDKKLTLALVKSENNSENCQNSKNKAA